MKCDWILISPLLVAAAAAAPPQPTDFPAVVAKVNEEEISRDQFWGLYQSYLRANPDRSQNPQRTQTLERAILDRLVDATLLYQEATQAGIRVEAAQVEAKLKELRANFPDQESFDKAVASGAYDEARLRADLRKDLAIAELVGRRIGRTIGASEEELQDWYDANRSQLVAPEEIRVSQILIKAPPETDLETKQQARAQIEECQKLVQASGNFAAVARRHSQDATSAATGGDLGWFTRSSESGGSSLAPELVKAAFALAAGQVSPILTTAAGYHLLLVSERRPQRTYAFEDIRGQIRSSLIEQKHQQRLAELIQQLRAKAKIEAFLQ
jgi:peptidyl-prolyl cis-trans isomerase C